MTHRRRASDDEAGAVLVIWVLALVGILAMAAMAIDLGNIAQTKEHTETAVQDAVLSAVPNLYDLYPGGGGDPVTDEANAVTAAETYLEDNYAALKQALAENPSLFDTCDQLSSLGIYLYPTASCFGFFYPADPTDLSLDQSNPTGMAVAIPTQLVNYTFGKAGGLNQQAVSSVAYADLKTSLGLGAGLPFGYSADGPTGLQCLKSGSGGGLSCTGFSTGSGQFGVLNSPRYTILPGSSSASGTNSVVETDIAIGIDHNLLDNAYTANANPICDANGAPPSCSAYNDTPVSYNSANYASPATGQTLQMLKPGLFTGVTAGSACASTITPRLNYPNGFLPSPARSCAPYTTTYTPAGPDLSSANGDTFGSSYPLNGVSIAAYLSSTSPEMSASATLQGCVADEPAGGAANAIDDGGTGSGNVWSRFDSCLSGFMSGLAVTAQDGVPPSDWILSSSITQSPRFGYVPIIASSNGRGANEIEGFVDAYLDLAFPKGGKVGALMAWIFPPSMVEGSPEPSPDPAPDYTGGPYATTLCSFTGGTCD